MLPGGLGTRMPTTWLARPPMRCIGDQGVTGPFHCRGLRGSLIAFVTDRNARSPVRCLRRPQPPIPRSSAWPRKSAPRAGSSSPPDPIGGDWDLFACRPDGSDRTEHHATRPTSTRRRRSSRATGRGCSTAACRRGETIDGNHYGTQGELVLASGRRHESRGRSGRSGEYPVGELEPRRQAARLPDDQGHLVRGCRHAGASSARSRARASSSSSPGRPTASGSRAWRTRSARAGASRGWRSPRARPTAVSGADCCTPDWFPDGRAIIFSNRPPGQAENNGNGWTQLWMADPDGSNRRLVYGEDGRHVYGGHVSPDGKYVIFTGNMKEDGDPGHSGAPMGLMRLADAPIIGGESRELRKLHPEAKSGPVLVLPAGWEPCWTSAEILRPRRARRRPATRPTPFAHWPTR